MREKLVHLGILRAIACFLVIVNHTVVNMALMLLPYGIQWALSLLLFLLCKTAVPLFVIVSGALLLRKIDTAAKVARRVVRIAADLVIFSALVYLMTTWGDLSLADFGLRLLTNDICIIYWYLYMYLLLLVVIAILQRFIGRMSNRLIVGVCTAGIVVFGLIPEVLACTGLVNFSGPTNYFMWPIFIFVAMAGHWAQNRLVITKRVFCIACITFVASLIVEAAIIVGTDLALGKQASLRIDQGPFATYIVCAISAFIALRYLLEGWQQRKPITERGDRVLGTIASCTFGIYLIHVFFLFAWRGFFTQLCQASAVPLLITIGFEIVIAVCSFACTWLLKRIPGVERLL